MQHECKITVIDKKCFTDYQEQYLADPKSGPCPFFNVGEDLFRFASDEDPKVRLSFIWASENIATNTPDIYENYMSAVLRFILRDRLPFPLFLPEPFLSHCLHT